MTGVLAPSAERILAGRLFRDWHGPKSGGELAAGAWCLDCSLSTCQSLGVSAIGRLTNMCRSWISELERFRLSSLSLGLQLRQQLCSSLAVLKAEAEARNTGIKVTTSVEFVQLFILWCPFAFVCQITKMSKCVDVYRCVSLFGLA